MKRTTPYTPPEGFTAEPMAGSEPKGKPEAFRLPKRGGDPFFGLTRAWYYAAEKDGRLTLIRLRQRGKQRGVVLVPYDAIARLVQNAAK